MFKNIWINPRKPISLQCKQKNENFFIVKV